MIYNTKKENDNVHIEFDSINSAEQLSFVNSGKDKDNFVFTDDHGNILSKINGFDY